MKKILLLLYGHLPLEHLLERDEGLCPGEAERLYLILKQVQQVVVVAGVEFDEYVVLAGGEMTLDDLGYFFQGVDHVGERGWVAEENAYVGASLVSERGGVDQAFSALYYAVGGEALDALMYGGTAHATFAGDLKVGFAGV